MTHVGTHTSLDGYLTHYFYEAGVGVSTGGQDVYDAWLESIGQKMPKPVEVLEVKPGKCDCGSESAGSSRHSTWCSAFEK